MKFEEMNETDVREMIVRPLLTRLGYEHGTENTIRTEQTFRYAKAYLGRKNASKDPPLVGRADYILEVASVGRWVVEVKGPNEDLNRDTVEQAHTYAAHPEVAAMYFMITNGRQFKLFRTSALEDPLMSWDYEDGEELFLALFNLVGPVAIRRKTELLKPDYGKPLCRGVSSDVQIIGGWIQYEDHSSNHPLLDLAMDDINGLRLPIIGKRVKRADDGRLHAKVQTARALPLAGELANMLEVADGYDFYSTDEFISTDQEKPTIFQNSVCGSLPVGTPMKVPGMGTIASPFDYRFAATTEAIGFVDGNVFKGTMELNYQFAFSNMLPAVRDGLQARFGTIPPYPLARGGGLFELQLLIL